MYNKLWNRSQKKNFFFLNKKIHNFFINNFFNKYILNNGFIINLIKKIQMPDIYFQMK